ncbi:hypothetical protein PPYR_09832 [Photinus pyralis]|uniref:Uncharacterized protein n=1 Tax=Photinus pyralis TaxID=7054 RepID=A0A5N4AEM6_PHOPY|nr:hypothetical protein PPYR_09832 [Photinus pyralis]
MTPKLYIFNGSPPARTVLITAKAVGLNVEAHVFTTNQELKSPEFLKLNPQHTVPTLDDDGKIIWDSHAIMIYLVTKYSKDRSLYPEDPFTRAVIHQKQHFDSGLAFPAFIRIVMPILFEKAKTIPQSSIDEVVTVYDFLETFLEGKNWVAGDFLTLADLSLLPTITTLDCLVAIDEKYLNIKGWIRRCSTLSWYHANKKGLDEFRNRINNLLA